MFMNREGFTLLEIVVAIVLLGLAALAFTPLFVNISRNNMETRDYLNRLFSLSSDMDTSIVTLTASSTTTVDSMPIPLNWDGTEITIQGVEIDGTDTNMILKTYVWDPSAAEE